MSESSDRDRLEFLNSKYAQKHLMCRDLTKYKDDMLKLIEDDLDFITKMVIHLPQELNSLAVKRIENIEYILGQRIYTQDNELDERLKDCINSYLEEKENEDED